MISPTHTVTMEGERHASKRPRASTVTIPVLIKLIHFSNSTTGRAACATCHQRKIRCDAANIGFPCSNCRKHFRSDCSWHQKRRRTLTRSPHHFVPILQAAPGGANLPMSLEPLVELAALQESPISPRDTGNEAQGLSDDAVSPVPGSLVEDGAQGCKRHLVEFIDQEDLSYRPIDKAARIAYVGEYYITVLRLWSCYTIYSRTFAIVSY
jgi:hypothetical protein